MKSSRILTYSQVKRMTSSDLEVLWDLDFETLITTALVDADGYAHCAVSDTLRSQRWAPRWRDALQACEGELAVAVERMDYGNDPRLATTARRLQRVRTALDEARLLVKQWKIYAGSQNETVIRMGKASEVAKGWLVKHHHEEWMRLATLERAAEGLPERSPTRARPDAEDGLDAYTLLIEHGHVDLPLSPYGDKLLDMSDEDFRNVVAKDVRTQRYRIPELRHPLLMHDWMAALQDLEEAARAPARAQPDGSRNLVVLDRHELKRMRHVEAVSLLGARRFYQAIVLRIAEWDYLFVEYGRTAADIEQELSRPWFEAGRRAGLKVCDAHPDEYRAILTALDPFLVSEGSDALDQTRLTSNVRQQMKHMILSALADGTWKNLLPEQEKEGQT